MLAAGGAEFTLPVKEKPVAGEAKSIAANPSPEHPSGAVVQHKARGIFAPVVFADQKPEPCCVVQAVFFKIIGLVLQFMTAAPLYDAFDIGFGQGHRHTAPGGHNDFAAGFVFRYLAAEDRPVAQVNDIRAVFPGFLGRRLHAAKKEHKQEQGVERFHKFTL